MRADHLEILVEEPSMEAFLTEILPKLLGDRATFTIYSHQGKADLMGNLSSRLRGYARWLPENVRIVVVVDRDQDDCADLKRKMEQAALVANLRTRSACNGAPWQVVNRLAIEELEAWFFGEWAAVRKAYPRISEGIRQKAAYRDPDGIAGGTWEALERVLKKAGYFSNGYRKLEAASAIGKKFDFNLASSPSFTVFRTALLEAVT
jgi:hypothetical protein